MYNVIRRTEGLTDTFYFNDMHRRIYRLRLVLYCFMFI